MSKEKRKDPINVIPTIKIFDQVVMMKQLWTDDFYYFSMTGLI